MFTYCLPICIFVTITNKFILVFYNYLTRQSKSQEELGKNEIILVPKEVPVPVPATTPSRENKLKNNI